MTSIAHRQGGGAVAEPHFVKIGGLGLAFVAGRHQDMLALPLWMDSRAVIRAVVPAFWAAVKSAVMMSFRQVEGRATMPAFWRSANGRVVEAR
jgi:hypothetical protein